MWPHFNAFTASRSRNRRSRRTVRRLSLQCDVLEERVLLALSTDFQQETLTVDATADESIVVSVDENTFVLVNGELATEAGTADGIEAELVKHLRITAVGAFANFIDVRAVTPADF